MPFGETKPAEPIQIRNIDHLLLESDLSDPQIDAILETMVGHTRREWTYGEAQIILSFLVAKGYVELREWADQLLAKKGTA